MLGFLEVERMLITDIERSSEADRIRKADNGWQGRWTYAVPVRRAWRVNRRIDARHLARKTFNTYNPVLIASRCELMFPEEARSALALPVTPTNVFGEPPLPPEALTGEAAIRAFFAPSRGVAPAFDERSFTVEDAENRLYVLKLDGDGAMFLGRQPFEVARKIVVKIGHAKEPQHRCDAHNAHLPPACKFKWVIDLTSPPFPDGEDAKSAEDALKRRFSEQFKSLGGEFFLCDQNAVSVEFAQVTRPLSHVIAAA